jgi:hypothetical protein
MPYPPALLQRRPRDSVPGPAHRTIERFEVRGSCRRLWSARTIRPGYLRPTVCPHDRDPRRHLDPLADLRSESEQQPGLRRRQAHARHLVELPIDPLHGAYRAVSSRRSTVDGRGVVVSSMVILSSALTKPRCPLMRLAHLRLRPSSWILRISSRSTTSATSKSNLSGAEFLIAGLQVRNYSGTCGLFRVEHGQGSHVRSARKRNVR